MDERVISVECIDTFDPKIIRITIQLEDQYIYSADIPEPIYLTIFGPLGWPPSPCDNS